MTASGSYFEPLNMLSLYNSLVFCFAISGFPSIQLSISAILHIPNLNLPSLIFYQNNLIFTTPYNFRVYKSY